MYKIVALMGAAGSGKDTILQGIMNKNTPEDGPFKSIVSCTTRPPRDYEKDGIDYKFLTTEEFGIAVLNKKMLEYTNFNSWFYGTRLDELDENKINIGVFNPVGVISLHQNPNIRLLTWYIDADDKTRLIRQLNREQNPNVNEIIRRYSADKEDFNNFKKQNIPYLYINNVDNLNHNLNIIYYESLREFEP